MFKTTAQPLGGLLAGWTSGGGEWLDMGPASIALVDARHERRRTVHGAPFFKLQPFTSSSDDKLR
jgi:hypothetical protein